MSGRRTAKMTVCLLVVLAIGAVFAGPVGAEVRLPHVLGDHMVLQRAMPLPIWGWAESGEEVKVTLGRHSVSAVAGEDGRWMVRLPAMEAGGPHELIVEGRSVVKLTDVLIGEVWLCSGQSNMEMGVGVVMNGAEEAATADYPRIRFLEIPRNPAGEPVDDVNAEWQVCSPETIGGWWGGLSAVGYFFGRELHRELNVPIGLIDSSWGGTLIGPWTPPCGFAAVEPLQHVVSDIEQKANAYKGKDLPDKLVEIEEWIAGTRKALAAGDRLPPCPNWPRHPLQSEREPTGLYNGMIRPLVPFAVRGVIWYQGESNVTPDDGMLYYEKMKALIGGWREVWGQGAFPFYYVQLAPFEYTMWYPEMTPQQMPRIWEAQLAALAIPNTGMAVTVDVGDSRDIHPKNKQEVGRRLSLWALAGTYGRRGLVCSGPLYKSMSVEGAAVRVQFDHVGGGLTTRDGNPPNWFEIAGADGRFVKAEAKIDGDTIVVRGEAVAEPVTVRFAWHTVPDPLPNLINEEGLPASPFHTRGR